MSRRVCPDCGNKSDALLCPACGTRTLAERIVDDQDPLIGQIFAGRYRIESLIGRGGMGAVYQATHQTMKNVVAVKVISSAYADDLTLMKRFHREAKAASMLSHPHTIRVFDFGQTDHGDVYMVMEYLEGRALAKALKQDGAFPPSRTLKIAMDISQSLAEAHGVSLVHRDLKPDNIYLIPTHGDPDFVKVLDFGLAKNVGPAGESAMTKTGMLVGTPHYMSPEQAMGGRGLTSASDIYSLGVIMFELLSGRKPFMAPSDMEILVAHVRGPVPDLPADVPARPELRSLLRQMLSKDPISRPSAVDLVQTLESMRSRETLAVAPATTVQTSLATPMMSPSPHRTPVSGQVPPQLRQSPSPRPPARQKSAPRDPGATVVGPAIAQPPHRTASTHRRTSTWIAVIAGVFGALAVATIVALWMQRGPQPSPPAPEPVIAPVTEALPTEPEERPKPALAVRRHMVRFDSNPKDCWVHEGERLLGKTPFEIEVTEIPGERAFVFKRQGYQDETVWTRVEGTTSLLATLKEQEPPKAVRKNSTRPGRKTSGYKRFDF